MKDAAVSVSPAREGDCTASIEVIGLEPGGDGQSGTVTVQITIAEGCTNSFGTYEYDLVIENTQTGGKQAVSKSRGWQEIGSSGFSRTESYYVGQNERLDDAENVKVTRCVCIN